MYALSVIRLALIEQLKRTRTPCAYMSTKDVEQALVFAARALQDEKTCVGKLSPVVAKQRLEEFLREMRTPALKAAVMQLIRELVDKGICKVYRESKYSKKRRIDSTAKRTYVICNRKLLLRYLESGIVDISELSEADICRLPDGETIP